MNNSRALPHVCASPSAPANDDEPFNTSSTANQGHGNGSFTTTSSCCEPLGVAKGLFSPFSPMDSQENTASNTTTPRRRLSLALDMDENAQSPFALEQDTGYGGSLGSSSACSLGESMDTNSSSAAGKPLRTPLGEITLNAVTGNGCQRKTLLARRLMKRSSLENSKENASVKKDSPFGEGVFKFPQPSLALSQQHHHRPCSLPTSLPDSPLTQQQHHHNHTPSPSSTTSEETRLRASSLNSAGSSGNLIKQISFPLERMSLKSPGCGARGAFFLQRSFSVASSTPTEALSDGYFSEVFEGEEETDNDLSDTITTLINAPFTNSPSPTTVADKPMFCVGESKDSPVPDRPTPSHPSSYIRSDSWCSPYRAKRGSLKRASPCDEITKMHRTKRPPLPFSFVSSNSQDSPPITTNKPLKGTPLHRSQSCCVPPNETLLSPTSSSPGGDDLNNIGDLSKPYALPLVAGTATPDLKCITPETVSELLAGGYSDVVDSFTIIDCRFPYEYEGGHITNAINIWEKEQLIKQFFDNPTHPTDQHRSIYIFHCEFSSKRGPQMSRFLRETDRRKNGMNFPKLYYPELYLMEGGYKVFFEDHQDLCKPQSYCEMRDVNHKDDLLRCKSRSKSWNGDSCRPRKSLRPCKSVFTVNENASSSAPTKPPCCRTISSPSKLDNLHP